ncbi:hypothetical protein HS1genome_1904 [Sulfodiicoccus acidiphilus]|uniref:Uncharacterized protein n=1 Tax=Sulfodiicoccus acidiphilus TaxID=1670455 RepID=A0A348B5R3_9CREN|nr:hypothetical protein [Sulfodiicoccus acidiphilus]BBD73515.1 hypothetical protein HS1genome_1904 [Sulfodiicoccus acidiphilus]GGT92596.1 hypothetical protein GCM10007116_07950 [Sulfodiicoccus acidiphilus]
MEEWEYSRSGLQVSSNYPSSPFPTTSFQVLVDGEFGNLIVEFQRGVERSLEGEAFVTIGIDDRGRVSYISIEPLDPDLKEGVKRIKNE